MTIAKTIRVIFLLIVLGAMIACQPTPPVETVLPDATIPSTATAAPLQITTEDLINLEKLADAVYAQESTISCTYCELNAEDERYIFMDRLGFSPDKKHYLFAFSPPASTKHPYYEIIMKDVQTSQETRIDSEGRHPILIPNHGYAWSPDSQYFAVSDPLRVYTATGTKIFETDIGFDKLVFWDEERIYLTGWESDGNDKVRKFWQGVWENNQVTFERNSILEHCSKFDDWSVESIDYPIAYITEIEQRNTTFEQLISCNFVTGERQVLLEMHKYYYRRPYEIVLQYRNNTVLVNRGAEALPSSYLFIFLETQQAAYSLPHQE